MRIPVAVLAIVVCLFLMQAAARVGFSRLLARYAVIANSIPAADEAVRLSPSDPEVHRARATTLNRLRRPAEAARSLESALSLRYRDDYLWLELGSTREEANDSQGALAAFDQAVRWAPFYAHTHWQRGNLLLRMGRSEEAFVELRKAAVANKTYLLNLIDLAWGVSRGDAKTAAQLIAIANDSERVAFIRFLAGKGKAKDGADQIGALATPLNAEQRNELVRELFMAKAFRDAFTIATEHPAWALFNGGFEEPLVLNNTGFGWMLSPERTQNQLAIDVSEKFAGSKSLQINLGGNWTPGNPLLSQTLIVEPGKSYRLSFSVKTKDLVTGGPPFITVNDATNGELLAKSDNISAADSWQTLRIDFTALATSQAAVIRLQRNNCEPAPCPIFGVLWLDEFHIEQTPE